MGNSSNRAYMSYPEQSNSHNEKNKVENKENKKSENEIVSYREYSSPPVVYDNCFRCKKYTLDLDMRTCDYHLCRGKIMCNNCYDGHSSTKHCCNCTNLHGERRCYGSNCKRDYFCNECISKHWQKCNICSKELVACVKEDNLREKYCFLCDNLACKEISIGCAEPEVEYRSPEAKYKSPEAKYKSPEAKYKSPDPTTTLDWCENKISVKYCCQHRLPKKDENIYDWLRELIISSKTKLITTLSPPCLFTSSTLYLSHSSDSSEYKPYVRPNRLWRSVCNICHHLLCKQHRYRCPFCNFTVCIDDVFEWEQIIDKNHNLWWRFGKPCINCHGEIEMIILAHLPVKDIAKIIMKYFLKNYSPKPRMKLKW